MMSGKLFLQVSIMVNIVRLVVNNWKIKLVSVIIGSMIWGYVRELKMETMNINIPVVYESMPSSLSWKEEPPRFIKITVRGRQENLKFPTSNLQSVVNLGSARKGNHAYRIYFDKRQIPEKIRIVAIPRNIAINFEGMIEKSVRIKAATEGETATGYIQGRTVVEPSKVTIRGPESKLSDIREVSTEVISLKNRKTDFNGNVKLDLPGDISAKEGKAVAVQISIFKEDQTNEKIFAHVPVKIINLDPALTVLLSDPEIEVRVRGEHNLLQSMSPNSFQAFVNLEGTRYNPKTGSILPFDTEGGIPIEIKAGPEGGKVDIVSIAPEILTVRFSVKPEFLKEPNGEADKPPGPKEAPAAEETPQKGVNE